MFYNGLIDKYEDTQLLCKDIIEKCLYFGDLESNNVFLHKTTINLSCTQSYTGIRETNYKFNSFVGDTLNNSLEEIWMCNYFKAVIEILLIQLIHQILTQNLFMINLQ